MPDPPARRRARTETSLTSAEKDERHARRLFLAGCLGLPLLWGVCAAVFMPKVRAGTATHALRGVTVRSAIGCAVAAVVFVAWVTVFQLTKSQWSSDMLLGSLAGYRR